MIQPAPFQHEGGAGLVELMIAMVLGLLLLAGLFQIHLSTSQSHRLQDAASRRQEALRYATLQMTRDLRMSGYRGCLRDAGQVRNTLNNGGEHLYNFAFHVEGFEAGGSGWSPALPAGLAPVVAGTDVLTVRTTLDPSVYIVQDMPDDSSALFVQSNLSPAPFVAAGGDIVLITDCGGAAIFQVTQFTSASGMLQHNPGGSLVPGNSTQRLGRRYPIGSEILHITTVSYFIRESAKGSGPALWRRVGNGAAEEVVEGIENLQLQFGVDSDSDQVPDTYVSAKDVGDWRDVTVVRAALLAASPDNSLEKADPKNFMLLNQAVGPFNDKRLRRVITVTVGLRNRLS